VPYGKRIVRDQTTMLATETQQIADYIRGIMKKKYAPEEASLHFADTRDTLCYATNDNQQAVSKCWNILPTWLL
jgi:4-hydroxy-3-methylbut-2-enyl diphosphate reductase